MSAEAYVCIELPYALVKFTFWKWLLSSFTFNFVGAWAISANADRHNVNTIKLIFFIFLKK